MRAAFGSIESTRIAADLLSSPHDATVGAAAKPTMRRYELMVGHANDVSASELAISPPIQCRIVGLIAPSGA